MMAIGKINVSVATAKKHRLIAWCRPAKVMGSGIARRVGFGFHDAPCHPAEGNLPNNEFADEVPSQSDGSGRQFRATQSSNQDRLGNRGIGCECFVNTMGVGAHPSILPNQVLQDRCRLQPSEYPMFCALGK